MIVSYYFSSPEGDVSVDDATLARPFVLRPLEGHPFMTLGDFFTAVKDFILSDSGQSLVNLLAGLQGRELKLDDVEKIIIRYEKYGVLYQISSAEVLAGGQRAKFAVNTAISDPAKETLQYEFDLLQFLSRQRKPSYLPSVYYRETMAVRREEGSETLFMTLSEWFEDYHEWHFSLDEYGRERIIIWDMGGGWRFVSESEAYEIIRQASRILTLYYGVKSYCMIYPWHHGAGDFVVKIRNGIVEVKLVTARGYRPLTLSTKDRGATPLEALLLFFLNTTVKMRLDKKEGMGEPYWAGTAVLKAVMDGFIDALRIESEDAFPATGATDIVSFLKSMSERDIKTLLYSLMDEYRLHDPTDAAFIQTHLDTHAGDLCLVIQSFSR